MTDDTKLSPNVYIRRIPTKLSINIIVIEINIPMIKLSKGFLHLKYIKNKGII